MLCRRKFLAAGSATLVSVGLPLTTLAAISSNTSIALDIDAKFKAECSVYRDSQLVARLNLVGLDTPFSKDSRLAQYILNFKATVPVNLPEASYELSHPVLGRLDLFLQPCGTLIGEQHDGIQYRACMAMLR